MSSTPPTNPSPNPAIASSVVMARLKAETQDLHDAAESHRFQKALARGKISREDYTRWLGQMLLLHRALESALRSARSEPAIAAVVRDYQYQEPYLLADLEHSAVDPGSIEPLPATAAIAARIDRAASEQPLALLGYHYVLEGSNNGSRFIARAVRRSLNLTPGRGDKYLDPYGDEQRALWAEFKADMGAVPFTPEQIQTLVDAAREMFDAISRISDDLLEPARA